MSGINDLTLKIATPNGSGSSSANGMLMKALFRMGLPVSGKNLFPSNIQGLPTWYTIRVQKDGFTARSAVVDLMVAMNAHTYGPDVAEVRAGGYLLYDSTWPMDRKLLRQDVTFLGLPFAQLCVTHFTKPRERILMKNIVYVGAVAALLDIDLEIIRQQLQETFASKAPLMDSNLQAIKLGYEAACAAFDCPLPIHVVAATRDPGEFIIDGNSAAALGCLYAGATVGAWYPITPSTSLMDAFSKFCSKYRVDPETGKRRYCIVQAEDELAAIGVVIGAGWNGARAFTPTSGPGISLMSEFVGYAYYAEIPAVIFDVQRTGPSTGMPTRTQQGDILACAYLSHGDTRHILLFPSNPEECFYLAVQAFDLAERFQTVVFVLSDLDIGMNDWVCRKLEWDDDFQPDRGKVLTQAQIEELTHYYRYLDVDGDGVCARTLPGTHARGAYFTRGSGHNRLGGYTEDGAEYQDVVDRLQRKLDNTKTATPAPVVIGAGDAPAGIVAVGSSDAAVREALSLLRQRGLQLDYMSIKAFPFSPAVDQFIDGHEHIFVVDQNRDGQLRSLLVLETSAAKSKLISIRHYNGMPIDAEVIVDGVSKALSGTAAATTNDSRSTALVEP